MNLFKHMKIKKKLLISFLVIALIASTSGIVSAVLMRGVSNTYHRTLINHGFAQGDVGKALAIFCRIDGNVHDAMNYENEKDALDALDNVKTLPAEFEAHMAAVGPTLQSDEAKQVYAEVMKNWETYQTFARH